MTEDFSADSLFDGALVFRQPRQGYRFSLDAPLLAAFARPAPGAQVLDLGAGCGVVGLGLAFLNPGLGELTLVEKQPRLARLSLENARTLAEIHPSLPPCAVLNRSWEDVGPGDLPRPADYIVSNPPYRKAGSGRRNPHEEAEQARHESGPGLEGLILAMKRLLAPRGRAALVFPAGRLGELLVRLTQAGLPPVRLRLVHPQLAQPAKLALVEARQGSRAALAVEAPLIVYQELGPSGGRPAHTQTALEVLGGHRPPKPPVSAHSRP